MRILLMLLVLANAGFFTWQHWYGADEPRLPAGQVDTNLGKGLALLSEADGARPEEPVAVVEPAEEMAVDSAEPGEDAAAPGESAPEASPNPGEIAGSPPETCASLGPFDQLDMAQVARDRLAAFSPRAAVRETGGQIRSGFWVYLPPFSSRAAAKDVEDELRERDVRDLFIVTGSEQRNAISLGLFSTPERADQRAAEIGRLGYTPRVAERFRDATVYWVDFVERPGEPLEPDAIGVMGASETLPEKRAISCADIAVPPREP